MNVVGGEQGTESTRRLQSLALDCRQVLPRLKKRVVHWQKHSNTRNQNMSSMEKDP